MEGEQAMNIRTTLIGALVTIVISALTAAVYMGALIERIKTVEAWIAGDGKRTEQAFKDFTEGPHRPIIEKGFNNPTPWGYWSEPVYCPEGYYVCGLKQRVEGRQGDGDDTAMNAVGFYCCPLAPNAEPNP